jgi:hypothetical protein
MSPRNFAILALATAASVGLAVSAVLQREAPVRAADAGDALFPGLLDRLNDAREIRITSPAGKLTVSAGDKGWALAEKAGYPVDPAQVRELALGLANLQLVEPKTADPKRLPRLELEEPGREGARSRLVEVLGAGGEPLAAAVVGKASPALYGGERGGVYVRRAGEDQAWLAAGELEVPADAMGLIGRELVDVALDRVARVTLQPPGGATAVTLARAEAGAGFTTDAAALPEGRTLDPVKVESLAGALAGLTMNDVKPAGEVTVPPDARRTRFETFDGLAMEVTVAPTGEGASDTWLTLRAEPVAAAAGAAEPVEGRPTAGELASRLDGWAFAVPSYLADRMGGTLDQLLADPPPAS